VRCPAVWHVFKQAAASLRWSTPSSGGLFTIRVDYEKIYDKTQGLDRSGIIEKTEARL
jgi:hypothetical protein